MPEIKLYNNNWSICIVRDEMLYVVRVIDSSVLVEHNSEIVYKEEFAENISNLPDSIKRMLAETVVGVYEHQQEVKEGMQELLNQERYEGWTIMN